MVNIKDKSSCCGCEACSQICPKQCIAMVTDEEGFGYPLVDKEKCIDCNICKDICPIINYKQPENTFGNTYVGFSIDDDIRMNSSSGGIFSELASSILSDNGIVFGAAFDGSYRVAHIGIENIDNLKLLQGSKYVQSYINGCFVRIKKELQAGRKVLFCGTPCQVVGLKSFLKNEYDNLFLVDILCHGVPSPKVWEKYISEKISEYNSLIEGISFRHKSTGWKNFSMEIRFENSCVYSNSFREDPYMKLFLRNICLRPSCYSCRFKSVKRSSDITIGDCWGVSKIMPEMDDDKGTSIILTHTQKGAIFVNSIVKRLCIKEEKINNILSPNADSMRAVKPHKKRKKFFSSLDKRSVDNLVKLCEPDLRERLYWRFSK